MGDTDIKGNVSLGEPNPKHTLEVRDMAKEIKPIEPEVTDKEIIEKMNIKYKPVDNKVLIKPMKIEKIKKELTMLDEAKNKNLKPGDEMHTKKVTKEVETDFRKGVVLAAGSRAKTQLLKEENIGIGDIVVFHKNLVDHAQFDLFKDSLLVNTYDIVCKYEE